MRLLRNPMPGRATDGAVLRCSVTAFGPERLSAPQAGAPRRIASGGVVARAGAVLRGAPGVVLSLVPAAAVLTGLGWVASGLGRLAHAFEPARVPCLTTGAFGALAPVGQRPAILRLLLPGRPAAVARLVVAVVVDALQRVTVRARPHVLQEGGETIAPPTADGNATPAIPAVIGMLGVRAPLAHLVPDAIKRASGQPVGSCWHGVNV